jgi:hypothetical protein
MKQQVMVAYGFETLAEGDFQLRLALPPEGC